MGKHGEPCFKTPLKGENAHLLKCTPDISQRTLLCPATATALTGHAPHPHSSPALSLHSPSSQQRGQFLVKPGLSPQDCHLQGDLHAGLPKWGLLCKLPRLQVYCLLPAPHPLQLSLRFLLSLPGPGPTLPCPLAFTNWGCSLEKGQA